MTSFRDRVESHPVGWLVVVGAASFITGVLVTLGFIQVILADRGPRDRSAAGNSAAEPMRSTLNLLTATPPVSVTSEKSGDTGNLGMTIQQFARAYTALDGRYSEQEAFIKRADRKRIRWQVIFQTPATFGDAGVTVYFGVPEQSVTTDNNRDWTNKNPPDRLPVSWAMFPMSFHDRLYALRRGDLIEITGVLRMLNSYQLDLRADDFDIVTALSPTPTSAR